MRLTASSTAKARFVLRCTAAATLAYLVASSAGLPHPVWAPISALVVSQENVLATWISIRGRFVGTSVGGAVALVVDGLGRRWDLPLAAQIGIAVAICASLALGRPTIRVCLWTCPLVLVATPSDPRPELVALFRGSEVVLGALIGGIVHLAEERAPRAIRAWFAAGRPQHRGPLGPPSTGLEDAS